MPAGSASTDDPGHHDSPQNATTGPDTLSLRQTAALEPLLSGASITKAAELAHVDRSTVHRWLREDPEFRAALNAAKREFRRELTARLHGLANAALEVVEKAVVNGDARVAIAVLRGIGLLPGTAPSIGPSDPTEIAEMDEQVARFREQKRTQGLRRYF